MVWAISGVALACLLVIGTLDWVFGGEEYEEKDWVFGGEKYEEKDWVFGYEEDK